MKVKPLLSCEVPLDKVNFPIYVSTKFDGIRALVIDGVVYSRSLKPIRNKHIQKLFGKEDYIIELAEKWKGKIDNRAYEALMNYEVDIDD